jgi:ABC-type Fe3+/spermidine/putrescine transport system ATPase subunit
VLQDINLTVKAGEFICLLGPSGCGKTTLLRCLAGLETPDQGAIQIAGQEVFDASARLLVPPQKRHIGMMFQHYALWPHMTIANNLAYPLRRAGDTRDQIGKKIENLSKILGISGLLERIPAQLSGGQQQRVALARALITHPKLILLDEPLSNLDASLRVKVRGEIRELKDRLGDSTTIVMVTHDQDEAAAMADRVVLLDSGRIAQAGTPEDLMCTPANRFVAGFVGYENLIPLASLEVAEGVLERRLREAATSARHADLYLAVHAEDITLSHEPRGEICLSAQVEKRKNMGRHTEFSLAVKGQPVIARVSSRASLDGFSPGTSVFLDCSEGSRFVQ